MIPHCSLLLLAAFLFPFAVNSQTIDPASEWRVNHSVWNPGVAIYYYYYKDFIDGDTVIGSHQYDKVYESGYVHVDWIPNPYDYYFHHQLHGFLREENDKWYTIDDNDQDALLFDFTLGVNDTVYSVFTYATDSPLVVTAIDSVLIDSVYRKRLYLNTDPDFGAQYMIEGIGATSGLFENMVFFEWNSELVCFAKNGESLWGATTEECDLTVNIPEKQGDQTACPVYPNPAHDFTVLSIPSGSRKTSVLMIDAFGQTVFRQSDIRTPLIKIPLDACHPGVYLIITENGTGRHSIKLLVQ
jgi:hypothetical protein